MTTITPTLSTTTENTCPTSVVTNTTTVLDTHTLFTPRDYQREARTQFISWYTNQVPNLNLHDTLEAIIAMATGTGKTCTACLCMTALIKLKPTAKILWVTHRKDLITQAKREIAKFTGLLCNIEHAKSRSKHEHNITIACVATLRGKRLANFAQQYQPNLIIFDEAHHAVARTWMAIKNTWPTTKALNLTATPFHQQINNRLSLGHTLLELNTTQAISKGILVTPKVVGQLKVDLRKVKTYCGDYAVQSLSKVLCQPENVTQAAMLIVNHIGDRRALLYGATIYHCKLLAAELRKHNFSVAEVYGDTPDTTRQGYYEDMKAGRLQIIINNMVLTEGFDMPCVSFIGIFRPTKNAALYVQMQGRGLRIDPDNLDKKDCSIVVATDQPKIKSGKRTPLPTQDDIDYECLTHTLDPATTTAQHVFLSWFHPHANNPTDTINITSGQQLANLLLADATPEQRNQAAAIVDTIWTQGAGYEALDAAFRTTSPDHFRLLMAQHGWTYLPRNLVPSTEELSRATTRDADEAYEHTLNLIASNDIHLKHFILDMFGDTRPTLNHTELLNHPDRCTTTLTLPTIDGTFAPTIWTKTKIGKEPIEFIQWNVGNQSNFLLHRDKKFFRATARNETVRLLGPVPTPTTQELPKFATRLDWCNRPASAQQLDKVAQLLPVDVPTSNLTSATASAIIGNLSHQDTLAKIANRFLNHRFDKSLHTGQMTPLPYGN